MYIEGIDFLSKGRKPDSLNYFFLVGYKLIILFTENSAIVAAIEVRATIKTLAMYANE